MFIKKGVLCRPEGEDDAGAGAGPTQDDLKALRSALDKEREQRKTFERELGRLRAQFRDSGNGEAFNQAERMLQEQRRMEEEYRAKLKESEASFEKERQRLVAERDRERQERQRDRTRQQVEKAFLASGGSTTASDIDGSTPFDYVWGQFGSRIQSDDEGLFVAGPDGKAMRDEDGKRVTPQGFFSMLREDPIHGRHFEPAMGSGSGARRSPDGRVNQSRDLMSEPLSSLFAEGFGG